MPKVALVAVLLAACGGTDAKTGTGPAGEVLRIEGSVTATRAGDGATPRPLAVSDEVFADDTVVTGPGSSVAVRLAHNRAVWTLGPDESRRVDASVAWRAPKPGAGESAFADTDPDRTASAGRHADMAFDEGKMGRPTKGGESKGGEQFGQGGYGIRGSGPGGGGSGNGSIGIGDVGTIGHGAGGGNGAGYGAGTGGSRRGSGSKTKVVVGEATVDGPLGKDVIRRVMRSRFPALKRCYEHELKDDPKFATEVRALFTVEPSGRLSPITVDPEPTPSFTSCLKGAIRAVHMPEADDETEVAVPITFSLQ